VRRSWVSNTEGNTNSLLSEIEPGSRNSFFGRANLELHTAVHEVVLSLDGILEQMKARYEIVFFDADDTLYDFKKCEEMAFLVTLREWSLAYHEEPARIYARYAEISDCLWRKYQNGEMEKKHVLTNRFRYLFEEFGIVADAKVFGDAYLANLGMQNHLMQNAEKVVRELSSSCIVSIITNGVSSVHVERLKNSTIRNFVSHLIVSSDEEGENSFRKPHPRIFEYAHRLSEANVPKGKILMIGDSLEGDIAGGNNYGVDTCWLNQAMQENYTEHIPKYEINDLANLFPIVYG
jgi:YjjG family noncanonical pyrimidine nucleotidase